MEILDGFTAVQIAIAILSTLAAAFIRGLAGFGFGILLVPILALSLTPIEAVQTVLVIAFLIAVTDIRFVLKEAEHSAVAISALVVLATAPGLMLLELTPPRLARLLIALVALSAFLAVLVPRRPAAVPGRLATTLTGLSAGLLTGFAAMPGPPVVPYYVNRHIPRHQAKASMIGIFGTAALAGIVSGAVLGILEWHMVALGIILFPLVLAGNWLGSLAFGKVSDAVWRTFVGVVLAAAALVALVKLI